MIEKETFEQLLTSISIQPQEDDYLLFSRYCTLLQEWNQKMNLTAITDDEGIAIKHFVDSLLPLMLWPLPRNARLIDVGSGAGFPSVPIKLIRRDLYLTLLDSQEKRLVFLRHLCSKLGIDAVTLHLRAEAAGRSSAHREKYDIATSRAVASLPLLVEYSLPLLTPGGLMLALKGSNGQEEAISATTAIALCGGKLEKVLSYRLPTGDPRTLVVIKKISQTPTKYPRPSAQIVKRAL